MCGPVSRVVSDTRRPRHRGTRPRDRGRPSPAHRVFSTGSEAIGGGVRAGSTKSSGMRSAAPARRGGRGPGARWPAALLGALEPREGPGRSAASATRRRGPALEHVNTGVPRATASGFIVPPAERRGRRSDSDARRSPSRGRGTRPRGPSSARCSGPSGQDHGWARAAGPAPGRRGSLKASLL